MARSYGDGSAPLGRVDPNLPNSARVYDALIGGKDNFAADRELRDRLVGVTPFARDVALEGRLFQLRVTRYLAGTVGIDQFLDIGAGLPTMENTHELAQRINLDATVVYVDKDPAAVAHGRALLAENEHTHYVAGDFTEPDRLLADPLVARGLDWSRPIALYLMAMLHHIPSKYGPKELMARYIDALPSGSFVAISHLCDPGAELPEISKLAKQAEGQYLGLMGTGWFRGKDEILGYVDGLELVEPGLVAMADWWPDGPRDTSAHHQAVQGVLARKP